jgi:mannose-6-phosphate isomerase-like protein (cupin superfamily)
MSGRGSLTIGNETAPITAGDGIPVGINQARSFTQTGSDPLEFLIFGVAKDMESKVALLNARAARSGNAASAAH